MSERASDRLVGALRRIETVAACGLVASARRLGTGVEEMLLLQIVSLQPTRQTHLAGLLGLSRSGAGAMVARLEAAGLVERSTDARDRRVRYVTLTAAARDRLREEAARSTAELDEILVNFDVSAQDVLERFFTAVADAREAAAKHEQEPPGRQDGAARPLPLLWG